MDFEIERDEVGPSLSGVDSDLKQLRGRRGAAYGEMSSLKSLQALPVVSHERSRQRRPMQDRGAIALDVIYCIARHDTLLGRRDSRIVSWTLNLDRRESRTLESRRQELCTEFGLEYKAYLKCEKESYKQFAGVLLRIQKSPCVEEDLRDQMWAKSAGQMRLVFDDFARKFLELGFTALRTSRDEEETLAAAREIFSTIPLGRQYAELKYSGTETEKLAKLLRDAAKTYFPPWVDVLGLRGLISYVPDQWQFPRFFAEMALHPGASEWHLMRLWLPRNKWKEYEDNIPGPRSKDAVSTAYEVMKGIFMALELSDDWVSLENPTGRSRRAPARDPITPVPVL